MRENSFLMSGPLGRVIHEQSLRIILSPPACPRSLGMRCRDQAQGAHHIFDGVPSLPLRTTLPGIVRSRQCSPPRLPTRLRAGRDRGRHFVASALCEKQCNSCHDKEKRGGWFWPEQGSAFLPYRFPHREVHARAPVGDCLSCHEPHSSVLPSLLKSAQAELCGNATRRKGLPPGCMTG